MMEWFEEETGETEKKVRELRIGVGIGV